MTARSLAADIAADIRKYGHSQGPEGNDFGVCVVTAASWQRATEAERNGLSTLLLVQNRFAIPYWNDRTPTVEVLATLDRIAGGAA